MRLQDIGFYTLSDYRAINSSVFTSLERCELILTDKCNFKCPYCRGASDKTKGTLTFEEAKKIVDLYQSHKLRNIRFSGGEVTLLPYLVDLVKYTAKANIWESRIAISTNGSALFSLYEELFYAGVTDFSISLDACCTSTASTMAGKDGYYETILENIKKLSELTYVTVGVVLNDENVKEVDMIIALAHSLGVSDIRIIPSAQYGESLGFIPEIAEKVLEKNPILKYRINNLKEGESLRGLGAGDSRKCYLGLDDMVIANNYHFPCVIYMREGGEPVGSVDEKSMEEIRLERLEWIEKTNCLIDHICKNNCLDVCRAYNNVADKCK